MEGALHLAVGFIAIVVIATGLYIISLLPYLKIRDEASIPERIFIVFIWICGLFACAALMVFILYSLMEIGKWILGFI